MNINIKELKKELSKVAGINFFSPEYRDIFKRHLGGDKSEESDEVDEAKTKDTKADETVIEKADEVKQDIEKDQDADDSGDAPDSKETDKDEIGLKKAIDDDQNADDDVQKAEVDTAKDDDNIDTSDAPEADNADNDTGTQESNAEEKALQRILDDGDDSERDIDGHSESDTNMNADESDVQTEDEAAAEAGGDITIELLRTKLELELVRAGIREDRLETCKRLFMPEFKASGGNVEEIKQLIAQYPEWIGSKSGAQGFGMPLGDKADALTNEEKALKRMGIDPRN